MALEMKRVDLHCVGATNNHCIDVYPTGSKEKKSSRQKVVVGDSSGSAFVFHVGKHHEMQADFQTAPPGTSGFPGVETASVTANSIAVSTLSLFQDQLFVMNGGRVNAYSRKGKHFFGFDSNVTEVIRRLQVNTPNLYLAGEYVLTAFQEATELGFYMCPDRIHDILIVKRPTKSKGEETEAPAVSDVLVACQDRTIRFVQDNKQATEGSCEAPVTSIIAGYGKSSKGTKGNEVIYGTAAGSLGAFTLTPPSSRGPSALIRKFTAMPSQRLAGITGLATCDVNQDGVPDIFVARQDGSVEVHTFGALANAIDGGSNRMGPEGEELPVLAWRSATSSSEGVTGISSGAITSNKPDEIVVSTYSGKIMTFLHDDSKAEEVVASILPGKARTAEDAEAELKKKSEQQKKSPSDDNDSALSHEIMSSKIQQMEAELQAMRDNLSEKKKMFSDLCGKDSKGPVNTAAMVAVASEFHVRTTWGLIENYDQNSNNNQPSGEEAKPSNSALTLTFEVDVPVDNIALQADIPLELYEGAEWANFDAISGNSAPDDNGDQQRQAQQNNEANNVVISATSPQLNTNNGSGSSESGISKMLCVVRPSDPSTTRVQVQFRPREGQGGTLRAFVTPRTTPRSTQLKTFTVHALCLHQRLPHPHSAPSNQAATTTPSDNVNWEKLPLVGVKMTGSFTVSDAHHWIHCIVPNIPEALPPTPMATKLLGTKEDSYSYFFRNVFSGTHLMVTYRKGEVVFMSENVTTLSIAKEFMTGEATKRKIGIRLANIPVGAATLQSGGHEASLHTLKRLLPLVGNLRRLSSQHKLIDALKEIDAQESASAEQESQTNKPTAFSVKNGVIGTASNKGPFNPQELYLPPEHIAILKNASRINLAAAFLPKSTDYIVDVVTRLFVDRASFMGEPAPTSVVQNLTKTLRDMLDHPDGLGGQHDEGTLLTFFQPPVKPSSPRN